MADFELQQVTIVRTGKNIWVPDVKVVNGRSFIGISKWCRHFFLFATGRALDFRKDPSSHGNLEFVNTLIKLRKSASRAAIEAAIQLDEDDAADGEHKRKAKKRRVAWHEVVAAELTGPAFVTIDIDGHEMTVLSELKSAVLWVEFNHSNLAVIKTGIRETIGHPSSRARRKKDDSGDGTDDDNEQVEAPSNEA
jgi:hypothetical protein